MPPKKKATSRSTSSTRKTASRASASAAAPGAGSFGQPELIVIADPAAVLRVSSEGVASAGGADISGIDAVASRSDVSLRPLFGPEARVQLAASEAASAAFGPVPDLSVFYHVDAPADQLEDLAEELGGEDAVVAAYVKPPGEPPILNDMAPDATDAPPVTPDFVARQLYLEPAPGGVDARYAWTWPGGGGAGVSIIDCEWGWRFDHEDLTATQGGVVVGTGGTDTNHGTAVIGEISADRNAFGITGICPDAFISAAAFSMPSATAIRLAADRLGAGDIILLEIHRAGPRNNFQARNDQLGYIAIEWWPDDFAAIQYATSRGVIVVEAAGNGAENLDDAIYSVRPPGFPATWTNPFNRANRDCGAVIVGAGAPPPGTHGRNHGADRSRLDFSNFGALIDCQGWGREVTSTGYGDVQGGQDARFWYTDTFSGTSSASPIVVGVLGSLQGALRAAGKTPMTPATARAWLRATGSPQQDEPGRPASQRIGNRPDLRQLIQAHVKSNVLVDKLTIKEAKLEKIERKELKDVSKNELKEIRKEIKEQLKENRKDIKDNKENKELKEPKEFKEGKEIKEDKEFKEGEKDRIKDRKEIFEGGDVKQFAREGDIDVFDDLRVRGGGIRAGGGPQAADPSGVDARLAALEDSVAALVHFIGAELRPDLGSGALNREPDLNNQAATAKGQKDLKDKESLADS
ncbi:MAG: S8 family serine peptidase [Marmoricola sp.]